MNAVGEFAAQGVDVLDAGALVVAQLALGFGLERVDLDSELLLGRGARAEQPLEQLERRAAVVVVVEGDAIEFGRIAALDPVFVAARCARCRPAIAGLRLKAYSASIALRP